MALERFLTKFGIQVLDTENPGSSSTEKSGYDLIPVGSIMYWAGSRAAGGATTATSGTGTVATITTTSAHGLVVGDWVTIAGISPSGYNGTYEITSINVTSKTFSYANTTTGSQTVAGTVTHASPVGWIPCFGQSLLRADYPSLDAVMSLNGYPYGTESINHFSIPDTMGRAIAYDSPTGTKSGTETYTLLDSNISSHVHSMPHTHPLSAHTHDGSTHNHADPIPGPTASAHSHTGDGHTHPQNFAGLHAHTLRWTPATVSTHPGTPSPGRARNSTFADPNTPTSTSTTSTSHNHGTSSSDAGTSSDVIEYEPGVKGNYIQVDPPADSQPSTSNSGNTSASSTANNADTPSPTAPSARNSFTLMQPFVCLRVLIKAW